MTPATADGGIVGCASPNDLPPPIRGDAPLFVDPHQYGRKSFDNAVVKPGEKSRSSYTREIQRRETSIVDKYK
jgi:hypothetical protein